MFSTTLIVLFSLKTTVSLLLVQHTSVKVKLNKDLSRVERIQSKGTGQKGIQSQIEANTVFPWRSNFYEENILFCELCEQLKQKQCFTI